MKKVIMPLLLAIVFIWGVSEVNAASTVQIVCSSATCSTTEFEVAQLNSYNTSSSNSKYKAYSSYLTKYNYVDYYVYSGSSATLTEGYYWTSTWSSTSGFSNKNVFDNFKYYYAGTYVFLVKQSGSSANMYPDYTEYIVYVSVKSDNTVGTIRVEKIKNSKGTTITATKETQLSFEGMKAYYNGYYESDEVFRLGNYYTGEYADKTKTAWYYINISGKSGGNTYGYIYDENGCVKSGSACYTFSCQNNNTCSVELKGNQALVFRSNQLDVNTNITVSLYNGLQADGYTNSSTAAYSNGYTASNGSGYYYFTIGSSGASYIDYTWNYSSSNVPKTGVEVNIVPYVVMVAFSLLVCAFLVTSRRKSAKEFYF